MQKQLVVRRPQKQLVVRKQKITTGVLNGPYKGKKVELIKRGMSGWHIRFVLTGEISYVFNHEI